ncbi:CUT domain-containing protein [Ditylenchus destructor]|uniref:One cut domain family member n=1 Tax=Ditylenchus destructor TaxID=166010 RepID=A0AAD4R0Y5_9BILA|nr:CUT domain-containing protein [Ditylenchus destructor]
MESLETPGCAGNCSPVHDPMLSAVNQPHSPPCGSTSSLGHLKSNYNLFLSPQQSHDEEDDHNEDDSDFGTHHQSMAHRYSGVQVNSHHHISYMSINGYCSPPQLTSDNYATLQPLSLPSISTIGSDDLLETHGNDVPQSSHLMNGSENLANGLAMSPAHTSYANHNNGGNMSFGSPYGQHCSDPGGNNSSSYGVVNIKYEYDTNGALKSDNSNQSPEQSPCIRISTSNNHSLPSNFGCSGSSSSVSSVQSDYSSGYKVANTSIRVMNSNNSGAYQIPPPNCTPQYIVTTELRTPKLEKIVLYPTSEQHSNDRSVSSASTYNHFGNGMMVNSGAVAQHQYMNTSANLDSNLIYNSTSHNQLLGNCSPPCSTSSLGQNSSQFNSMATSCGYHQQSHQQSSGSASNRLPCGFLNIVVSDTSAHDHARQMQLQQQQSQIADDCDSSEEFEKMGELELNTRELAQRISQELKRYSIPQAIFAQRVLCRSQGTLSDLLRNPKPWSKLKSGRETFRRMAKWLQEPEFQRMSALRLAACKRKEEQHTAPTQGPNGPRLVFTDIQRRTLQAIFKETKRPSREMQLTISQQLGLDPTTVANFFMNARRRGHDHRLHGQSNNSGMSEGTTSRASLDGCSSSVGCSTSSSPHSSLSAISNKSSTVTDLSSVTFNAELGSATIKVEPEFEEKDMVKEENGCSNGVRSKEESCNAIDDCIASVVLQSSRQSKPTFQQL